MRDETGLYIGGVWGFSVGDFTYHVCFLPKSERVFFVGSSGSCVVEVVRGGSCVPNKKDRILFLEIDSSLPIFTPVSLPALIY